jgi:hypothetical protein
MRVSNLPSLSLITMAGLDPATQRARVCERKRVTRRADARLLDGRLNGGRGEGFGACVGAVK